MQGISQPLNTAQSVTLDQAKSVFQNPAQLKFDIPVKVDGKTRTYKCEWNLKTVSVTRDKTGVGPGTRLIEWFTRGAFFSHATARQLEDRIKALQREYQLASIKARVDAAAQLATDLNSEQLYGQLSLNPTDAQFKTSNAQYTAAIKTVTTPISEAIANLKKRLGQISPTSWWFQAKVTHINKALDKQLAKLNNIDRIDKLNRTWLSNFRTACSTAGHAHLYERLELRVTSHVNNNVKAWGTRGPVPQNIPEDDVCKMLLTKPANETKTYLQQCAELLTPPAFSDDSVAQAAFETEYLKQCKALGDLLADTSKTSVDIQAEMIRLSSTREDLQKQISLYNAISKSLPDGNKALDGKKNKNVEKLKDYQNQCDPRLHLLNSTQYALLEKNATPLIESLVEAKAESATVAQKAEKLRKRVDTFLDTLPGKRGLTKDNEGSHFSEAKQELIFLLGSAASSLNHPHLQKSDLDALEALTNDYMAKVSEWEFSASSIISSFTSEPVTYGVIEKLDPTRLTRDLEKYRANTDLSSGTVEASHEKSPNTTSPESSSRNSQINQDPSLYHGGNIEQMMDWTLKGF